MKTKSWIIFFAAVILISAVTWFVVDNMSFDTRIAAIYKDGTVYKRIDLNAIASLYDIQVYGRDGSRNTVRLETGQVYMAAADCPDQICVNHVPISDGVEPIVCLPNKVTIQIEKTEGDNADTFAG